MWRLNKAMQEQGQAEPNRKWNGAIPSYFYRSDVTFVLWIALTLISAAIAVSLLEYLAGWPTALLFRQQHPILELVFHNWFATLNPVPLPGLPAIAQFLALAILQPRILPWPRWRIPSLVAISIINGVVVWYAPVTFKLTILIGCYGLLVYARIAFGRSWPLVPVALLTGIVPALWLSHQVSGLQFSIWVFGALLVQTSTGLGLQEREARFRAESLADELRHAEQQLRSYALRAEEAATLRERERVAREIHDTLAQGLAATIMHIEAGMTLLSSEGTPAWDEFDQARELARSTLTETRSSILEMRSYSLDEQTLSDALAMLASRLTNDQRQVTYSHLNGCDESMISRQKRLAMYRIAQEAVANAIRHGHANTITIELSFEDSHLHLTITDDGIGFPPDDMRETGKERGFGLIGMRERARILQGHLEVISNPGSGTQIAATFPVSGAWEENIHVANTPAISR